jgi:hypothetical protein
MIISFLEILVLIKLFPQTGLSRILYIPIWIIIFLFVSLWLTKKSDSLKKIVLKMIIVHIILFHIMLWSWPQSAAIKKNLIPEFYGKIL